MVHGQYSTPRTNSAVLEIQVYLSQVLHLFKMSFIDGSPSIFNNKVKFQRNRWSTCNRYTCNLQDCSVKYPIIPRQPFQPKKSCSNDCLFGSVYDNGRGTIGGFHSFSTTPKCHFPVFSTLLFSSFLQFFSFFRFSATYFFAFLAFCHYM